MVKHTLWKEIHKLMKVQPLTLTTRRPLVWLTCMFQGQEFHFFHHATTRWREFFIWLKLPLKPEVQPKESICVSTIKQITNQKIYIYISLSWFCRWGNRGMERLHVLLVRAGGFASGLTLQLITTLGWHPVLSLIICVTWTRRYALAPLSQLL